MEQLQQQIQSLAQELQVMMQKIQDNDVRVKGIVENEVLHTPRDPRQHDEERRRDRKHQERRRPSKRATLSIECSNTRTSTRNIESEGNYNTRCTNQGHENPNCIDEPEDRS